MPPLPIDPTRSALILFDMLNHYLKPSDPALPYRLVFETDGERVTRYRAGRLPEVEWVEGCA